LATFDLVAFLHPCLDASRRHAGNEAYSKCSLMCLDHHTLLDRTRLFTQEREIPALSVHEVLTVRRDADHAARQRTALYVHVPETQRDHEITDAVAHIRAGDKSVGWRKNAGAGRRHPLRIAIKVGEKTSVETTGLEPSTNLPLRPALAGGKPVPHQWRRVRKARNPRTQRQHQHQQYEYLHRQHYR